MGRKAKGKRPIYLDNAQTDQLLAVVMALAGEVSVLRTRLDTLERILQEKGILSPQEIEAYQPNEAVMEEREQWRMAYLDRLLRVINEEVGES